jgi:large conductance mechanosensitive channel protein
VIREFKQFPLGGNVVDPAVGIVGGAAFWAMVIALVKDFITPLIAALIGTSRLYGTASVELHEHGPSCQGSWSGSLITKAVRHGG